MDSPSSLPSLRLNSTAPSHTEVLELEPTNMLSTTPSISSNIPSMHSIEPSIPVFVVPSGNRSESPSAILSLKKSVAPSTGPSSEPSQTLTEHPSLRTSINPTLELSSAPSNKFSSRPSNVPSFQPTTSLSVYPSVYPTKKPSNLPSDQPTIEPSTQPSSIPSAQPSVQPSTIPSTIPSVQPSTIPSSQPSAQPSESLIVAEEKVAITTMRFEEIDRTMNVNELQEFESITFQFVDETKSNVAPTNVTLTSVRVAGQNLGGRYLDVNIEIFGELHYWREYLKTPLSFEEIVLMGFVVDFNLYVHNLKDRIELFENLEYLPIEGVSNANAESGIAASRSFGEDGLTEKEIFIIVGGLSGFLALLAIFVFIQKRSQHSARTRVDQRRNVRNAHEDLERGNKVVQTRKNQQVAATCEHKIPAFIEKPKSFDCDVS